MPQEFESVSAEEPKCLGEEPGHRHGSTFGSTQIQFGETERQQTEIPKEILGRDDFVESDETEGDDKEGKVQVIFQPVAPRQDEHNEQLR